MNQLSPFKRNRHGQVTLAQQYIPMYDQGRVKWSNWVETETIPIIDKEPVDGGDIQRRIKELMHDMEMHNEYYDEDILKMKILMSKICPKKPYINLIKSIP